MIVFINAPHGLAQPQLFRRFVGIAALATDSPIGQVACFEEPALFTPIGIVYDDPDGLARWPQVNERNSQTVTKTFFERLPKNFQGDILQVVFAGTLDRDGVTIHLNPFNSLTFSRK